MRWLFAAIALALASVPASADWYVSASRPGWDVFYDANGAATQWFHRTSHTYAVWNGAAWEYRTPPDAWTRKPQVDRDAVLRRGNFVERIGPGVQEVNDWTATPANDAGKWHVYIVYRPGEAMSAKLRADWRASPNLLAFAKPGDPAGSWAHYTEYANTDTSQFPWRFDEVDVSGVPVVIVQPPIDGSRGDPHDVAFQASYRGDPKKLANAMSDGIRRYLASGPKRQPELAPYPADISGPGPMPFKPKPKPEPPVDPAIPPAPPGPTIPPDVGPVPVPVDWDTLKAYLPWALVAGAVLLLVMQKKPAPAVEVPTPAAVINATAEPPKKRWGSAAKKTQIPGHPFLAMVEKWEAERKAAEEAVMKKKQEAVEAAKKLAEMLKEVN